MIEIFSNDIPVATVRDQVSKAVREAIGDRPGDWEVEIHSSSWIITVTGPNAFEWRQEFFGPDEHDPEFIKRQVDSALPR
jgi:hypothetical protein